MAIFSAAAAPEHQLHEKLHSPLVTRKQIRTAARSHNTAQRAMIFPLPLERLESLWLH